MSGWLVSFVCKTTGAFFTIEVLIWAVWARCPENKSSSHILSVLYFLSFSPFHLRTDMHALSISISLILNLQFSHSPRMGSHSGS